MARKVSGVLTPPRRRYMKAGRTPGWDNPKLTVFLDGKRLVCCLEASEPLGHAWIRPELFENPRPVLPEELRGHGPEVVLLEGDVEIRR